MSDDTWKARLLSESARAFHAFTLYRDLPASERSLEKVQQKYNRSTSYRRQLAKWSSRFAWVARAAAYDVSLDAVRREAAREALVEMATRQAQIGMDLQTAGMAVFIDESGNLRQDVVQRLKPQDAIRALEVGVKIERVARGEPAEILKADHTIRLARELTDDELAEIIQREALEEE